MSTFLSQADSQFTAELRLKQDIIDRTNVTIRELSAVQKNQSAKLESLKARIRARNDRQRRVSNLRRSIEETRARLAAAGIKDLAGMTRCSADFGYEIQPQLLKNKMSHDHSNLSHGPGTHAHQFNPSSSSSPSSVPPLRILRARLAAYNTNNKALAARAAELKARSGELETRYRRVVSLCTGVDENRVEEMLPALVAAVESESGDGMEVTRVREFLRKVEGV